MIVKEVLDDAFRIKCVWKSSDFLNSQDSFDSFAADALSHDNCIWWRSVDNLMSALSDRSWIDRVAIWEVGASRNFWCVSLH